MQPAENAILLPTSGPPLRPLVFSDGSRGASLDASYLQFIVEELIRFSAVDLAIDPSSAFYGSVDLLPPSFRRRIRKVDKNRLAREKTFFILAPVYKALGMEFPLFRGVLEIPNGIDHELAHAILLLTLGLERFLIGSDHRVQVDIDLEIMLAALAVLMTHVHNMEARANLVTFEGVLRTYRPFQVPSLVVRPDPNHDLSRRFQEFVEDETYRYLSREAGLLGFPSRATHAVITMRRAISELLAKPRFQDAAELTSQAVTASTALPTSTSRIQRLLAPQSFLPPLVSLQDAHARAAEQWAATAPPFIPTLRDPYFDGARALPPENPH
jgi:hypothetical protein